MHPPRLERTGESTLLGLVYSVRPWQWYKQLILYIAVIFSGAAGDPDAWIQTTMGVVLFSFVAGSTYVLNDVVDRPEDRHHHRKQHRPIASGQVLAPQALGFVLIVYLCAGILAWQLNRLFFGLIVVYVVQNIFYSCLLKNYLFIDLLSVSIGFVIRAIAGVVLVSVELSPWIVVCTFLAALLLGVSKRWGERQEADDPPAIRHTLTHYSEETLRFMLGSVATMILMAYTLYTFFAQDQAMMLTIPFAFYAVFRFVHLTIASDGASEPALVLLDRQLLVNFALWGTIVVVVLYRKAIGVTL